MKVFFVVPRFHTNMTGWINTLKKDCGCEVEVHSMVKGFTEDYSLVTPVFFKRGWLSKLLIKTLGDMKANSPKSFPDIFYYFNYLKRNRPDYIVVRDISRYFSFLAAICAKILRINIVIYSQVVVNRNISTSRRWLTNFINFFFNSYWVSPLEGDTSIEVKLPSKLVFVPFCIYNGDLPNKVKVDEITRFLTVGKFVERKNFLLLLSSIKELKSNGYNIYLTLIGEVSNNQHKKHYAEVITFIEENDLDSNISVVLNVDHSEMKSYYKESDCFILAATREPASISVLEAMSYGTPSICSDTCGTRFYVKNNYNGLIFKDNDELSLTETLSLFIINSKIVDYNNNCYKYYSENFSPKSFQNALIKYWH